MLFFNSLLIAPHAIIPPMLLSPEDAQPKKDRRFGLLPLGWAIAISATIMFLISCTRHLMLQSTGYDLGIFDQAIYLISQGQTPFSSLMGFHILGDHGAWIFYLIALLYKIYPHVFWLFLLQSVALALGALPIWYLAKLAGLKDDQNFVVVIAYLLYPVVFNANLFDFHPEVMAIPALAWAVLSARLNKLGQFLIAIVLVLGCKAALSLTVIALGIWLIFLEKRRIYGAIALTMGTAWFIFATKFLIPSFSGAEVAAVSRYNYLGNSVFEIITNVFLQPQRILKVLFSWNNLRYLLLLLLPVAWGLRLPQLTYLIPAVPALLLNLLADYLPEYQPQKDIVFQYSVPIVPFLILVVIHTLAAGRSWIKHQRIIIIWSLVFFLGLARWSYFITKYLPEMKTWQATKEAIARVPAQAAVLADNNIVPQISHRQTIQRVTLDNLALLNQYDCVLLNQNHQESGIPQEAIANRIKDLQQMPEFHLDYQRDGVWLFKKNIL